MAAGAFDIVENAKVFQKLEDCVADLQRVFATTVRPRDMTQLVYTPETAASAAIFPGNLQSVGILFGRERSGLTNEEIATADAIIAIPSFKHFSSLNLGQAVNIVGYELWKRQLQVENVAPPEVWLQKDEERLARRNGNKVF